MLGAGRKMALTGGLLCCQRVFGWVPVLIISLVVLWSYYAYVFELCLVTLTSSAEKVTYLTVFHIIFVFFVWTYWKAIFTPPQQPDKKFHMSYTDKERYENEERSEAQRQILVEMAWKLPVYTRTGSGAIRFCHRCQLIKPDRCHHCSVCAVCVLKMDHHCPWVNNCIGFSNYKFFLLFLAYSLLYCMFISATVLKYFIKYKTGELTNGHTKFHILFLLLVAIMFLLSLMILFGYHCWLVSRNRSTLEAFSAPVFQNGPDKNGFNLGFVKNLQQVFGEEKKLWLLPLMSRLPPRFLSHRGNGDVAFLQMPVVKTSLALDTRDGNTEEGYQEIPRTRYSSGFLKWLSKISAQPQRYFQVFSST